MGNEAGPKECSRPSAAPAEALWYVAPNRAELRPASLDPSGVSIPLTVRTLWSGISRGTERLVASGRVPPSEFQRMRAPLQAGNFPFPVKYGYCAVGEVEEGPAEWVGRTVFALHPHQDRFVVPASLACVLPAGLPPRRAVLAANMETALNGLWDAGAVPAQDIVVVGGGVVGMLIAWLCGRMPGAQVTLVDIDPTRAALAHSLGVNFAAPQQAPQDADLVFHASGAPAGLSTALECAGMEATVVEMSWFGERQAPVPLGGAFHSRRLKLVSSQVGQVAPAQRARWTHGRRLAAALSLLQDDRLDALITEEIRFADLPDAIPRILADGASGLVCAIRYP